MPSVHGVMITDRPERYAKQLLSHWSARGPVTRAEGVFVQSWADGRTITLRPGQNALDVHVNVPADQDAEDFAQVVAAHLERFGQRDELHVQWDTTGQ